MQSEIDRHGYGRADADFGVYFHRIGQHFTSYRATRFVRDIIPCLLLSVFAGIIAWGVFLSCTSLLGRLIAPLLVFTAVYLLGTYTARVEIWKEFFKWKTERNK